MDLFYRLKRPGGDLPGKHVSLRRAWADGWFRRCRAAVGRLSTAQVIPLACAAALLLGAGPAEAAKCLVRIVAFS